MLCSGHELSITSNWKFPVKNAVNMIRIIINGSLKVPQIGKMNSEKYCGFLDEALIPWLDKKTVALKRK